MNERGISPAADMDGSPSIASERWKDGSSSVRPPTPEESFRTFQDYRRLVEMSPDAIVVHCGGRFVYANRAAARLLGASTPHQLIGMPILKVVHPDYHEVVRERTRRELEDGAPAPLIEEKLIRLDGRVVDVEVVGIPVTYHGRPAGQAMIRDITERKRAEEAHRQTQELLQATLESTADGILVLDQEDRALFANGRFTRMWGIPDDAIAAGVRDNILEAMIDQVVDRDAFMARVREPGPSAGAGLDTIVLRDGRVFERYSRPLVHGEELAGRVMSFRDVTQQKRAEQELHAAEAKYRALVENIPAILYEDLLDDAWTTTYASPQIDGILGLAPEEYVKEPGLWERHLHPEDRESAMRTYAEGRERGEPFTYEYRMIRPDGEVVWIEDHAVVIQGEQGGSDLLQGAMFDVTARKRAERELQKQNELLAALHEMALGLIDRLELDDLLQAIVARASALVGTPDSYLYVADPSGTSLVCEVGTGVFRSWVGLRLKPGEGIGGRVWQTGQPMRVQDYDAWPHRSPAFPYGVFHAAVGVPLKSSGRVIGVIGLTHGDSGRRFGHEDISVLERLAELASICLDNARLYRDLQSELAERKRAEGALRFQAELLTHVQNAVVATDPEGLVTYWNDFAERIYGWSSSEVLGRPVTEFVRPGGAEQVDELRHALRGRSGEFELKRRDGSVFSGLVMASPLKDHEHGFTGSIAVTVDVTERKRAEEAYRESERRYREMLENVQLIAVSLDSAGLITFCNDFLLELTGWTRQEVLGRDWFEVFLPEEERDGQRALFDRELSRGSIRPQHEYAIRKRNGDLVLVAWSNTILRDHEGTIVGTSSIGADVTERRSSEESLRSAFEDEKELTQRLRALDEMKNTFLHAVSHELRTPLAAVLGLALTLEREDVELTGEESLELVRRLASNARKLDQLLSDLLDLDRLARGILEPRRHPTDIGALVRRVVESSDLLGERPIRVQGELVVVSVDAAKVERIVENLLANAVRHTPPGTTIWVRVRAEGNGALLMVEDEGPGVPQEYRESIFEPFVQGPRPVPHSPGVGVGLSLVRRFAELHGGRAWVESREGGGASFRILLPGVAQGASPTRTGTPTSEPYSVHDPS